jgi:hypothetical protein
MTLKIKKNKIVHYEQSSHQNYIEKSQKTKINEVDFENLQFVWSSLIICWNAIISMKYEKNASTKTMTDNFLSR